MSANNRKELSWFWIVVGFVVAFPVGIVLLLYKLFLEDNIKKPYQMPRQNTPHTNGQGQHPYQTYAPPQQAQQARTDRNYRAGHYPNQKKQPRRYTPPHGQNTPYTAQHPQPAPPPRHLASLLSGQSGRGMQIFGGLLLGGGVLLSAITFMTMMNSFYGLIETFLTSGIVAAAFCVPGAILSVLGRRNKLRAFRLRTYCTIIGQKRQIDLDELAATIPTSFEQVYKDLQWMLDKGFFPGAYLDAQHRCLIYVGEEYQDKDAAPQQEVHKRSDGTYPEEARIHRLNDRIVDEYVSMRLERLAELTHKIYAYLEGNPSRETRARQFKQHYLPKTIKILESYAKFEQQGVHGSNIQGAMADIEKIMDTLVSSFEKQLDILFEDEVVDITSDITVLESMMTLEGLHNDPFGELGNDLTRNL